MASPRAASEGVASGKIVALLIACAFVLALAAATYAYFTPHRSVGGVRGASASIVGPGIHHLQPVTRLPRTGA